MKLPLITICMMFVALVGYIFISQHNASSLNEDMKDNLKKLAVEYIRSDPVVKDSMKLNQSWSNYNLGSDEKTRFTADWLNEQQALIYISANNQATVEWQGIPGCNLNGMWELGYKPDLKDGNGKVCQTWWQVRVAINKETKKIDSLDIKEVGYEEGV